MIKRIFIRILLGILVLVLLTGMFIYALLKVPVPQHLVQHTPEESLMIKNVNIVDLVNDSILSDQFVIIENRKIESIGHRDSILNKEYTRVIDGHDKFVIPALWDMHIHMFSINSPQLTMPLFIANGVTNVRDLGGGPELRIKRKWQNEVNKGNLLGPRIISKAARIVYFIRTEEDARELVNDVEDSDDFIKVYNNVLPDPFQAMAEEARKKGIRFLGHKPRSISAIDAVRAGHKSMEHARLFLFECYPGAAELREEYRARISGEKEGGGRIVDTEVLREMVDTHDPQMFQELVNVMIENNSWYVPTHITRKMDAYADNAEYLANPGLKYISPLQQYGWKEDAAGMVAIDPSPEGRQAFMDFYNKGLELTAMGYEMGLPILAGTDANDTYCIPGFGLHDELEAMVEGGLSPRQALLTATHAPAVYYQREKEYGTIAKGKTADLILLDENPLEDIKRIRQIHAVVFNGVPYEREELDEMLEYIEDNVKSWSMNAKLIHEFLL